MVEFTPEKSKKIALARLDIIHQWLDFRKKSTNNVPTNAVVLIKFLRSNFSVIINTSLF